jgi:hypothetical protein
MASALIEMGLQSLDGVIRLAPACPADWTTQFSLKAAGGFRVTSEIWRGKARYALIESERGGKCRLVNPWKEAALVSSGGKQVLKSDGALLEFDTEKGKAYRVEREKEPVAGMAFAPLKPAPSTGQKTLKDSFSFSITIGHPDKRYDGGVSNKEHMPVIGIDAQGRTPHRTRMQNNVEKAKAELAAATAGQKKLELDKAGPFLVPDKQSLTFDLGAGHTVKTLVFSRDRSGLFVDYQVMGYKWEASPDGKDWTVLVDSEKRGARQIGQIDKVNPAPARYLRLTLHGRDWFQSAAKLDDVSVYGE